MFLYLKRNPSILIIILLSFVSISPVFAQYGLKETADKAGLNTQKDIPTLAGNVVGTALSIIGVLFFILMIYGGFLWMTARGNDQQTEKAKTTITAAVIGMVIILSAYAITNFVFQAVNQKSCQPRPGGLPSQCTGTDFQSCIAVADCEWK